MKTRRARKLAAQTTAPTPDLTELKNWLKANEYKHYNTNRWQRDQKLQSGKIRTQRIDVIGAWVLLYRMNVNWEFSPPMRWVELNRGLLAQLKFKPTRILWPKH